MTAWQRQAAAAGTVLAAAAAGCSGPQPLAVAIRPADESGYGEALRQNPQSPRHAFFEWKSRTSGKPVTELARLDELLTSTSNPFSARSDHDAASRGAVVYKEHCASCHGENADGRGPAMPLALPGMDFHAFDKRLAATIHGGAPKAWFQKINEGFTSETPGAEGKPVTMPAFGQTLAREQVWLTITYLQSLDMNAQTGGQAK
jgi:mono/diheme cytochrome c family protein